MTSKAHIQAIETIIRNDRNMVGKEPLLWDGSIQPMKVYKIPLEHLIYNPYNGRILSRTKSIENNRDTKLDMTNKEDFLLVDNLLWKSSESRNKQTIKDIKGKGQLKTGIITTDGVIIDGNRRAMLLNRLGEKFFRAIVLPIRFDEDPMKIEELETTYQMGEDEKLGYNPIEKYLKAQQLFDKLTQKYTEDEAINKIKDWMGETKGKIEDYLKIVKLIDEYLAYLEYDGIYAMADTPNDGKEDLFLFLKKWIEKYFDKQSADGFDGYDNFEVEELKFICFDYIRAKIGKSYDGKFFRNIADGRKENHFFGNNDIWKSFKEKHNEIVIPPIQKINDEMPIDSNSKNIENHLSARDKIFKDFVLDDLEDNIKEHLTELMYKKSAKQPMKLTNDAKKALSAIDRKNKSFEDKDVLDDVARVSEVTAELLRTKSIAALIDQLMYTLNALENIEFKSIIEDKEESLQCLKELREIQPLDKLAYDLEKKIKAEK
jgi:hypothetical protein